MDPSSVLVSPYKFTSAHRCGRDGAMVALTPGDESDDIGYGPLGRKGKDQSSDAGCS